MMRGRHVLRTTLVVLLLAICTGVPLVPGTSAGAAASARPGQLLSSTPFTAYALPLIPLPARAWRISYSSRTVDDVPVVVGGTVLVPTTPWAGPGSRPLVGFSMGTQGLADRCAASTRLASGTEYESLVLVQLLARGWAVAISDYQGLGTAGEHTYVVGRALGRNVLDSMRAARNLRPAGLDPHGPAAVYGYSEGGAGAGWALQLQPTYAPDVRLRAGAVGAVPTNFRQLLTSLNTGPFAFLILYSASGFDAAYPALHLSSYLNAKGKAAVDLLRTTCIEDGILTGLLMDKDYRNYVSRDPFSSADWRARTAQNDLGTIRVTVPVLVGGARQDEVIPFATDVALYRAWCARGTEAYFDDIPLGEHLTGIGEFSVTAIDFLAQRFAGSPGKRPGACAAHRP